MAIKFSQFVVETSASTMSHIVGYDGVDNIQITPNNFFTSFVTGTAGQVPFFGSTTSLLGDAEFNWDNTNKRLGIGTTSPSQILTVRKDSTTTYSSGTTAQNTGDIVLQNNNQTVNNFNRISFQTNSDNNQTGDLLDATRITAIYPDHVGANPSGELAFETKANGGTMSEVMRINKDGNVGIGTSSPGTTLDVVGTLASSGITQLGTGGSNVLLTSASAGNVGIGTSSPAQKLVVIGNIGTSGSVLFDDNQGINFGNSNAKIIGTSADGIKFFGTGSEKMRLTQAGNVGIGTTSPQSGFKLDVNGNAITRGTAYVLTDLIHYGTSDFNINASNGSTNIKFEAGASERMRITSAGNVGIGTVNPTTKLEINADNNGTTDLNLLNLKRTWSSGTSTDRSHGILFSDFNSSMATIYADRTNSGANYNSDLLFATNTGTNGTSLSTKMIIKNTGNVGIGTTSPDAKLDVNGGVNGTHAIFSGQDGRGLKISTENTLNNDDGVVYDAQTSTGKHLFKIAGTERMRIDSAGNVGIGTTSPTSELHIEASDNPNLKITRGGVDKVLLGDSGSNNGGDLLLYNAGGTLTTIIRSGSSSYLNGGNVGIGTTSPDAKLQVRQIADTTANILANGDYGIIIEGNDSGTAGESVGLHLAAKTVGSNPIRGVSILGEVQSTSNDHDMLFATSAGGSAPQERMRIDSSSTTKITSDGTNTAGTILELHFPNNNSTDRCATINLTNNVGGYAVIEGGTTGANNSGYIAFKTDNAGTQGERMRVINNGNVGIGTTTPTAKLTVVGLAEHADNAAAISAGLTTGAFYRTGDLLKVVH